MSKEAATMGFSQEFAGFDPEAWKKEPPKQVNKPKVPPEKIREVAQKTGFPSRQASTATATVPEKKTPSRTYRTYRTGRSDQMNLKVRSEDKEVFYEICLQNNWVLGEAFQLALEALQRELATAKKKS